MGKEYKKDLFIGDKEYFRESKKATGGKKMSEEYKRIEAKYLLGLQMTDREKAIYLLFISK